MSTCIPAQDDHQRALTSSAFAGGQMAQRNGDGQEEEAEEEAGTELGRPWVCIQKWNPQEMEVDWEERALPP